MSLSLKNEKLASEPICGHWQASLLKSNFRWKCSVCGSLWDEDALNSKFTYDQNYPEIRGHFETSVQRNRIRDFKGFISRSGVSLQGRIACEVGFGGESVLGVLQQECDEAYGIETVTLSIENAIGKGVPKERLFNTLLLPPVNQKKIDLWIFHDSFEHIPNPSEFLPWMEHNTASRADVILVTPQTGRFSEMLLGRLWPHKLPDHTFQWSTVGIDKLFAQRGPELRSPFFPLKHISLSQILTILSHKYGSKGRCPSLFESQLADLFKFGQMGLHLSCGR